MDTTMTPPNISEFTEDILEEALTYGNRTITNGEVKTIYKLLYGTNTIADTPPPPQRGWWNNQKEEGINPMNTYDEGVPCCAPKPYGVKAKAAFANAQIVNAVPVEATQRDYAIERIKAIGEKHAQTLRVQFDMVSKYPETFLELEALIKAGEYTVSDRVKDEDAKYCGMFYGVTFGKPADKEGYEVAKATLNTAAQKALDQATLYTIDELEGVIDDFEAWEL